MVQLVHRRDRLRGDVVFEYYDRTACSYVQTRRRHLLWPDRAESGLLELCAFGPSERTRAKVE